MGASRAAAVVLPEAGQPPYELAVKPGAAADAPAAAPKPKKRKEDDEEEKQREDQSRSLPSHSQRTPRINWRYGPGKMPSGRRAMM